MPPLQPQTATTSLFNPRQLLATPLFFNHRQATHPLLFTPRKLLALCPLLFNHRQLVLATHPLPFDLRQLL